MINPIDELANNSLHYQKIIEELQHNLKLEKLEINKLKPEIENREAENTLFKKDLGNLKDIYERKIEALSGKVSTEKDRMHEFKSEVKNKNEVS